MKSQLVTQENKERALEMLHLIKEAIKYPETDDKCFIRKEVKRLFKNVLQSLD